MIVHQSDLKAWHRCGEQHRRELNGDKRPQLSATAYGSVMHHALHILERTRDLQLALNTFDHYWSPLNIDEVCEPVEEWIAKQTYGSLREKGLTTIKAYWEFKKDDPEEVLALEFPFAVELEGTLDTQTGKPHMLLGTVDRLALRHYRGKLHVCVDDWKTGSKPGFLKHHTQFTAYAYATTTPEFWVGNAEHHTEGFGLARGAKLIDRLADAPRHGYWIDLTSGAKWRDAGVRYHRDYLRFLHAVDQYVRARQNHIFPLNISGETCEYCPFRDDCPEGIDSNTPSQKEK